MGRGVSRTADVNFDRFWVCYPRHEAKEAARRAWEKLKPSLELQVEMHEALTWQRLQPQWIRDGGKYVPHPASWLNGKRWEDERPADQRVVSEWHCPHTPHCNGRWRCDQLMEMAAHRETA